MELPVNGIPAFYIPVIGRVGYHLGKDGYDVTNFDWKQFLIFSNLRLQKIKISK
jgi:hypothetical protein